jgi:lysophospholipase L1-like esterase
MIGRAEAMSVCMEDEFNFEMDSTRGCDATCTSSGRGRNHAIDVCTCVSYAEAVLSTRSLPAVARVFVMRMIGASAICSFESWVDTGGDGRRNFASKAISVASWCRKMCVRFSKLLAVACGALLVPVQSEARAPITFDVAPDGLSPREGVPSLRKKLQSGERVVIAFLGGSITKDADKGGFVEALPDWLKQRFPAAEIDVINAGVPGTGSDFGAHRTDRDVLVHNPDLIVVEFAVNDGNRNSIADMERIVRKTWMKNSLIDLLFVYTVLKPHLELFAKLQWPSAAAQHEQVARHYKIPSLTLGVPLEKRISARQVTWEQFSNDLCHPTPAGYALLNEIVLRAFDRLLSASENEHRRTLGASLTPNLELRPPKLSGSPMQKPEPLIDRSGRKALLTWELPQIGTHWVGQPAYHDDDNITWLLHVMPAKNDQPLTPELGLKRTSTGPARWFEEARSFTGSSSEPIAKNGEAGWEFGATESESGVLVFRAPETGSYVFEVRAAGVMGYSDPAKAVALNVVIFPKNSDAGRSIAFHTSTRAEMQSFRLETKPVFMNSGDEVGFIFLKKELRNAAYSGFHVRAGFFREN